jgi:hypothetical protein
MLAEDSGNGSVSFGLNSDLGRTKSKGGGGVVQLVIEAEPEDGAGVPLRREGGVGAGLAGGIPKALFQPVSSRSLLRCRDPVHEIQ